MNSKCSGRNGSLKKIFLMLAALLITAGMNGCYLFPKEEVVMAPPVIKPPDVKYNTVEVVRGTIEKKISGIGNFISTEQVYLFYKDKGGRLEKIHVKAGEEVKKGDLVASLYTGTLETQLKQQDITVRKAQLRYDQLQANGSDKFALSIAALDIESAKLTYENLKLEYENSKLISTMDGTAIFVNDKIAEGDNVNAFQTLVTIDGDDPERLYLQSSSSGKAGLQPGTKVKVTVQEVDYAGEVVMTPAGLPSDANEDYKKYIFIRVEKLPQEVKRGFYGEYNISIQKKDNVLLIPSDTINEYRNRKYVYVLEDGVRKERNIGIGLETPTQVEVLEGLAEGEQVILK